MPIMLSERHPAISYAGGQTYHPVGSVLFGRACSFFWCPTSIIGMGMGMQTIFLLAIHKRQ